MDKLERLHDHVWKRGIHIVNTRFSKTKKAACMGKEYKNIILDKSAIESKAEEGILLVEELGHYETEGLFIMEADANSPFARMNRGKQETKVRHFSYKTYLTVSEIQRAAEWCGKDDWAIAEYCGVPLYFLRDAIEYYRSCGVVFNFYSEIDCP